jgi:hypothetical protein
LCHHRAAPSWGDDLFAVKQLYHGFPAFVHPSSACTRVPVTRLFHP